MAKTIEQARIEAAARVITAHFRQKWSCTCGAEWTPLHVAKMLNEAGALGPQAVTE